MTATVRQRWQGQGLMTGPSYMLSWGAPFLTFWSPPPSSQSSKSGVGTKDACLKVLTPNPPSGLVHRLWLVKDCNYSIGFAYQNTIPRRGQYQGMEMFGYLPGCKPQGPWQWFCKGRGSDLPVDHHGNSRGSSRWISDWRPETPGCFFFVTDPKVGV